MRDVHLTPPDVGERISRRYLQALQDLAGHNHDPGVGVTTRDMQVLPLPPEPGAGFRIYTCTLTADLLPGSYAAATLLIGLTKSTTGDAIIVYDEPTSITTGKKIANGTVCRVFKDHDMQLASNQYVLLIPFACEVDQ